MTDYTIVITLTYPDLKKETYVNGVLVDVRYPGPNDRTW